MRAGSPDQPALYRDSDTPRLFLGAAVENAVVTVLSDALVFFFRDPEVSFIDGEGLCSRIANGLGIWRQDQRYEELRVRVLAEAANEKA